MIHERKAQVFEAGKIITADNRDLNPVRLRRGKVNPQGRQTYLPEIESMNYSEHYLNLLHDAATYCGTDPEKVSPVNLLKIQRSLERYLK